jgi:hypothetical protein
MIIKQLLEAVQALQAVDEMKALQAIQEPQSPMFILTTCFVLGYRLIMLGWTSNHFGGRHLRVVQLRSFPHLEGSVN